MATMPDAEKEVGSAIRAIKHGTSSFKYEPLPGAGCIRIMELYPGPEDSSLSCSLHVEKLEDVALKYEALSYVWGTDAPLTLVAVDCDGQRVTIGSNLASALRHVRDKHESRRLWVDAVCIGQASNDEKPQQVRQMGKIFASATNVIIWMGEDEFREAVECFGLIQETTATLGALVSGYEDVNDMPPITYGDGIICADPYKWKMVERLWQAAWFSRVWVLQEVGLPRTATLYYGKASMDWSHWVELILFIAYRADVASHTGDARYGTIWDMFDCLWRSYSNAVSWRDHLPLTRSLSQQAPGNYTLLDILCDGRMYEATDPRDHVYAFLSHPTAVAHAQGGHTLVDINYDKSVDDVYTELATRVIETDRYPWTVLTCFDHANALALSGQRQSWVPRWEEVFRVSWLGYVGMWYQAGGLPSEDFRAEVSKANLSLRTNVIVLDEIRWASQILRDEHLVLEHQQVH